MKPRTEKKLRKNENVSLIRNKTVAIAATVFFIFNGMSTPTSFAVDTHTAVLNGQQQLTRVIPIDQADSTQNNSTPVPLPSGAAIQVPGPLSFSQNSSLQEDGNPSPAVVNGAVQQETENPSPAAPEVPDGWTWATSNINFAFKYDNSKSQLDLMDLATGSISKVDSINTHGPYASSFGIYDVLSDGSAVIWSVSASIYGSTTYIRKLDGSGETFMPGTICSTQYDAANQILRLDLKDTSSLYPQNWKFKTAYTDVRTLQPAYPEVPEGWTRTIFNEGLVYRQNGGRVEVMDLTTGEISDKPTSQNITVDYDSYQVGICYVITPEGLKEIYDSRHNSNISIAIYDPAQGTWFATYSAPSYLTSAVSPDGKYFVIGHTMNQLTLATLSGAPKETRYSISAKAGYGVPLIGGIAFTGANIAVIRVADGSNRWIKMTINTKGSAALTSMSAPVFSEPPDTASTVADASSLAGIRSLVAIGSVSKAPFNTIITPLGNSQYRMNFDVSGGTRTWSVGYSAFDDFGTPAIETADLSYLDSITVGLRLAKGTGSVKFQIELDDGTKIPVTLTNLGTTEKFYEIDLTLIRQLYDLSRVKGVGIVVEYGKVQYRTQSVEVRFGHQPYTPVILGTTYDTAAITVLPSRPVVGSGIGGGTAVTGAYNANQVSAHEVRLQHSNLDADDFAFVFLSNGYYTSGGQFVGQDMDLRSGFTVALNGTAGQKVKLEIKDTDGSVAVCFLTLAGALKNYTIPASVLSANFPNVDLEHIGQITFVVEKANTGANGALTIQAAGLDYRPVITTPTNAALTDFSALQPSASKVEAVSGTTVPDFTQTGSSGFNFNYNLSAGGSQRWAAGMILFSGGRFFDATATDVVLNVHVTGASYYNIEVEDVNGAKVVMRANVLNGKVAVTKEMLLSAEVPGFDAAQIRAIVLVVDDPQATVGQMTVQALGLYYELPSGWTRVASNDNYAFRIEADGGEQVLTILNLTTQQEKELLRVDAASEMINPLCDVSPDGAVAVFGATHGAVSMVYVQDLATDVKKTTLNGSLDAADFLDQKLVRLTYDDQGAVTTAMVDYNSMTKLDIATETADYIIGYAYEYYLILGAQVTKVPGRSPLHSDMLLGSVKAGHEIFLAFQYSTRSHVVGDIFQAYDILTGQWRDIARADYLSAVMASLPAGWSQSASNLEFAFKVENAIDPANHNNYTTLKVRNLLTGATQDLYKLQSPPYQYVSMDVSADGQLVYFSARNNYTSSASGWLRVQRLDDPAQKTDIMGIPHDVSFLPNGDLSVTVLTHFRNGTELGNVYVVDHTTLQSTLSHIKLVAQANAVLDEGYLVIPVQITYSNTYEVTIYDASAGMDDLVLLSASLLYHASQSAGGTSGSGSYALIDAYKTPAGRAVISIGISATGNEGVDYSKTFLLDLETAQRFSLDGAATAVTYQGNYAAYTIGSGTVWVDLSTLTVVPPVPAGWTRAPSNPYFAFRIHGQRAGSYTTAMLQVMDLRKTDAIANIASTYYPVGALSNQCDVLPDGNHVVYSAAYTLPTGSQPYKTYIKDLSTGAIKLTIEGELVLPSSATQVQTRLTFTDGTVLLSRTAIDLSVPQTGPVTYEVTTMGSQFTINETTKVAMHVYQKNYYTAMSLYDLSGGRGQMTLLRTVGVTSSYSGDTVSLTSLYATSTGRAIVSYSSEMVYAQEDQTTVMDAKTGQTLTFNGRATSVTYTGDIAVYQVTYKNGTKGAVRVDLKTLQIVAPQGWTRTNNSNFVYRVVNWGVPRVVLYQWVEVMNLTTGKVQRLRTYMSGPSWGQVFSGVPVVSADGKSVKISGVTAVWGWGWPHFWSETYSLETGKKIV